MANYWWMDPPKNDTAGGDICWKKYDDAYFWVDNISITNRCGFNCVNAPRFFPPADRYESYNYHMYFKFQIPDNAWTIQNAHITTKVHSAGWVLAAGSEYLGYTIKVYTTPPPDSCFPYQTLSETDYDLTDWNYVGEWEDLWDIFSEWNSNGQYWLPMFDVTSEFQYAKSQGYTWFAVRLTPKYDAPAGWSYNYCPGYNERCWADLFGPLVGTGYTGSMPEGHPEGTGLPTPWLKITYTDGDDQWEPGEPDNTVEELTCITSDYVSQSALIGTSKGGLWRTWNSGDSWAKIFDESPVTGNVSAVYMDAKRNITKYPSTAIAYFGTESGYLYKSIDSMQTWSEVTQFPGSVTDIMSSNANYNKIAVGTSHGVWVSKDAGVTWNLSITLG